MGYQINDMEMEERKIIVGQDLMNQITALCDIAQGNPDKVLAKTAKAVREQINKGLDYAPSIKDINIADIIYRRKQKAIEVLKGMPDKTFVFNDAESYEDLVINDAEPYIFTDDGSGIITDTMVLRARYSEDGMEFYALRYGEQSIEWIPTSEALGYTENNVYDQILGGK